MKEITHIDCPKEWIITNDWDSHLPLLWLASKGEYNVITEFGSGSGSTFRLASEANKKSIPFSTWENNIKYYGLLMVAMPNIIRFFVKDWKANTDNIARPGLLFIDCAPGEIRKGLCEKFKDKADVIVIHDTEESAEYVYGMKEILSTFKYRLDFKPEGLPHTTAVSNFVNVEDWV